MSRHRYEWFRRVPFRPPGTPETEVIGGDEREDQRIAALATCTERIVPQLPFEDEAKPLGHAPTGDVARIAAEFQATGGEFGEGESCLQLHRFADIALPHRRFAEPVANLEGSRLPVKAMQASRTEEASVKGVEDAHGKVGAL